MLRELALSLGVAAGLTVSLATSSPAIVTDSTLASQIAQSQDSPVDKAAYIWLGRSYCFYPVGWHGPGWYWCGYPWVYGVGWGGVWGWHGWRGGFHGGGFHGHWHH
jgi:hypothetical protein